MIWRVLCIVGIIYEQNISVKIAVPSRHSSVGRASTCSHTVRQWWHNRSWFLAPPMPAHKYVEDNGSAAILAAKKLAGVTSEVNLNEHVTCTPLSSMNKAAHSNFKTQRRNHHKSKTGVSVVPTKKDVYPPKTFKIKKCEKCADDLTNQRAVK